MEKILIEPSDKSKLDLVKSMLEAMRIRFQVVSEKDIVLSNIKESYLEAKDMEEGKVEYKTYSSFSEMENDL